MKIKLLAVGVAALVVGAIYWTQNHMHQGSMTTEIAVKGASLSVDHLEIENAYIRATPPRAPVSGGYMVIRNTGNEPDRLVGGEASFAGKVEIHEMSMDGDVMKMRELTNGLEIPANSELILKPGGYHIMFMQLSEDLPVDETRSVTLVFEKAGKIELQIPIRNVERSGHSGH